MARIEPSCTRTNLKVGYRCLAQSAGNFLLCTSTFLALHVHLVVFGERFRDEQYILVSFLMFAPRYPAICKSGDALNPVTHFYSGHTYVHSCTVESQGRNDVSGGRAAHAPNENNLKVNEVSKSLQRTRKVLHLGIDAC